MDITSIRLIATAAAIGMGTISSGARHWLDRFQVGRSHRPESEAASKVQTMAILAIAFAEAIAIYALVIALIIKFVQ